MSEEDQIQDGQHIYLIAGEASGDFLGAQLMKSLKAQNPDIRFSGIGGSLMTSEGLESLFPMEELSVMGIAEVLPTLGLILKRIKQTIHNIIELQPDKVITIDAPDFSFRVVKGVRKKTRKGQNLPKFIHYVAPTVWAWRSKRAKKIAQFLDALICLFDFEPPYFEREGLKAVAVGHPMMESGVLEASGADYRKWTGIDNNTKILGVFFGSRNGEIKRVAPTIVAALKRIIKEQPDIELIILTLPHLEAQVQELLAGIKVRKHIIAKQKIQDKWEIFKACDTAIAVSGTVGLELVAANIPHVIAFKVSNLTHMMLKRLIRVRFAHLTNIMLDQEVVPEFLQQKCKPKLIADQTLALLNEEEVRNQQLERFQEVRNRIGQETAPSELAANFVLTSK